MNRQEAIEILETIQEVYPKFVLSKRKANMLLPVLQEMDYQQVTEKLSHHVATHPYAPTMEEIAAYPAVENNYLQLVRAWREEAASVPADVKMSFYQRMNTLLAEKAAAGTTSIETQNVLASEQKPSPMRQEMQKQGKGESHDSDD